MGGAGQGNSFDFWLELRNLRNKLGFTTYISEDMINGLQTELERNIMFLECCIQQCCCAQINI